MTTTQGVQGPGERGLLGEMLEGSLHRTWWALAIRGLLAILVGLLAISWPQVTLMALLVLLGSYLILDGIFALVAGLQASNQGRSWWPYLLEGLLGVVVGVMAFTRPVAVAFFVLLMVAIRSVISGAVAIAAGSWLRRETGRHEWLLWLAGLMSIGFGVFLLARPAAGVATLVWLVCFYGILFGILEVITALRWRGAIHHRPAHAT